MNITRHHKIIELMERHGTASVHDLADALGCTEMTIRRNLDQLQEQGIVKREHGYAYLLKTSSAHSSEQSRRYNDYVPEKKAIAREAFSMIRPGMSICLDSGSTIQYLVEMLPDRFPLSVITSSLDAAMTMSERPDIQTLMPGGFLHHRNRSLLVDDADELQRYKSDIAFIACRSFQLPGGTFEYSQALTNTKRALVSVARQTVLLLDHSKWNVSSIFNCIPLEQIDVLITDDQAPEELIRRTEENGKKVIVVSAGT